MQTRESSIWTVLSALYNCACDKQIFSRPNSALRTRGWASRLMQGLTLSLQHNCLYMSHNTARGRVGPIVDKRLLITFPVIPEVTHEHTQSTEIRAPFPQEACTFDYFQKLGRLQGTQQGHDINAPAMHLIYREDTTNETLKRLDMYKNRPSNNIHSGPCALFQLT